MRQMPHGLSELLLRLYRLGREADAPAFKEQSFALIKEYLPFESGLWGAMTVMSADRTHVHWVHLDSQPLELITNWQEYSEYDALHRDCIAEFGRTCMLNMKVPHQAARFHPKLVEHTHTYQICQVLATVTHDPVLNVRNAISFYRGWSARPFTEDDRQFKQELVPHLAEAWNLCVIRYVDREPNAAGVVARAVTDRAGSIHNAEPGFTDLLRTEFPDWLGPMLPPACVSPDASADGHVFKGREILLTNLRGITDGMRLVGIQRLDAGRRLSPRELAVAREFATGRTYTEIAGRLGVAPKTVRNHLQSVYGKLGVKSKVGLVKRLDAER